MQIDKLVHLLESPIFVHLRLQLLDVEAPHHTHLLKSCYGLLMLLPQSDAFRSLNHRLATVCNLRDNLGVRPPIKASPLGGVEVDEESGMFQVGGLELTVLVGRFDEVMELHRCARRDVQLTNAALQGNSVVSGAKGGIGGVVAGGGVGGSIGSGGIAVSVVGSDVAVAGVTGGKSGKHDHHNQQHHHHRGGNVGSAGVEVKATKNDHHTHRVSGAGAGVVESMNGGTQKWAGNSLAEGGNVGMNLIGNSMNTMA